MGVDVGEPGEGVVVVEDVVVSQLLQQARRGSERMTMILMTRSRRTRMMAVMIITTHWMMAVMAVGKAVVMAVIPVMAMAVMVATVDQGLKLLVMVQLMLAMSQFRNLMHMTLTLSWWHHQFKGALMMWQKPHDLGVLLLLVMSKKKTCNQQ